MHIVYISREYPPSLRAGGIATYLKTVADKLVENGHLVTIIAASDNTNESSDYIEKNGVRVIRLQGGDFVIPSIEGYNIFKRFRSIYRFKNYRKSIKIVFDKLPKIDIVEFADYGDEDFYFNIKEKSAVKHILRLHTPIASSPKSLVGKLLLYFTPKRDIKERLSLYDNITACSKHTANEYTGLYSRHEKTPNIRVIYNPTKLVSQLTPVYVTTQDTLNIVFVGTVVQTKGVGELLEACNILQMKGVVLHLTIVGKLSLWGDERKRKYDPHNWVEFVGNVPHSSVIEYVSMADIVCLPSYNEPFGLTCIEAMMCEKIVIGSLRGGMSEIITNGKDGFLIEPKDPSLIVSKIEQIINMGDSDKHKIQSEAKKTVQDRFSDETIVAEMIDYYVQ